MSDEYTEAELDEVIPCTFKVRDLLTMRKQVDRRLHNKQNGLESEKRRGRPDYIIAISQAHVDKLEGIIKEIDSYLDAFDERNPVN
jgi:hypothetical protein